MGNIIGNIKVTHDGYEFVNWNIDTTHGFNYPYSMCVKRISAGTHILDGSVTDNDARLTYSISIVVIFIPD